MRRDRRQLRGAAVAAAVVLAGVIPAGAAAHAIVGPAASRPADLQRYTLTVPNEGVSPTVEVDIKVPANVGFFLAEDAPSWTAKVERRGDRVDVVRFTGGAVAPGFFATFHFIARNPVQEGELVWKVKQVYAGGRVVLWAGGPGSDTPASVTRISEAAPPGDVVDVVGGKQAVVTPAGSTPGASGSTAKSRAVAGGRDGLALGLGAAGLVAGLVALGLVVLRRRR